MIKESMSSPGRIEARQERIAHIAGTVGRDLATKTVLYHHHVAARLGLSVTDLKCLDLLRTAEVPLTAKNLAELIGLTGGAITGVADRLEAAGLVERVRDPDDRRRWELRPVLGAQATLGAVFAPLGEAMADLAGHYDESQLDTITSFLVGLEAVLDDQTQALRVPTSDK
jgi:DNA-binding MarR family transcriptional regulator